MRLVFFPYMNGSFIWEMLVNMPLVWGANLGALKSVADFGRIKHNKMKMSDSIFHGQNLEDLRIITCQDIIYFQNTKKIADLFLKADF